VSAAVLIPHDPIRGTLHALTRSAVYGLFAGLLAPPQDPTMLADQFEQAHNLAAAVPARLPFAWSTGPLLAAVALARSLDPAALAERYRALFERGDDGVPLDLRESHAGDDELAATRLTRTYERHGYAPLAAVPFDHLAQELSFLRHLAESEADQPTPEARAESRGWQADFIDQHPGRWVPQLASRADAAGGRCPFGGALLALSQWLPRDRRWLRGAAGC
jgi:TorA maturation chaperone TorD